MLVDNGKSDVNCKNKCNECKSAARRTFGWSRGLSFVCCIVFLWPRNLLILLRPITSIQLVIETVIANRLFTNVTLHFKVLPMQYYHWYNIRRKVDVDTYNTWWHCGYTGPKYI